MSATDHDDTHDEFGERVEGAREGIVCCWDAEGETHCAVGGDNFKDWVESEPVEKATCRGEDVHIAKMLNHVAVEVSSRWPRWTCNCQ